MKARRLLLFVSCLALVVSLPGSLLTAGESPLGIQQHDDRLVITNPVRPIAEFVFRDEKILRPYFANVLDRAGLAVTRNHPPIDGQDAVDHETMHPGLWFAFGDVNGADFWRNKGRIEHVRFIEEPEVQDDRITFATECRLLTADDKILCTLINRYTVIDRPYGWLIVWDALFHADRGEITFGDQEEMGFGARVATPFTEKNGGIIRNSHGIMTAEKTWGQPAAWCDYSGDISERLCGITLMPDPDNFRESWWHNRDYGVMVANPFGRAAMKQGEKSAVIVQKGETFRIRFAAAFHGGDENHPVYDPADEFKYACQVMKAK
ncbi:MAG: DUF6807 family protein [Planctomycetaceae bacterium]